MSTKKMSKEALAVLIAAKLSKDVSVDVRCELAANLKGLLNDDELGLKLAKDSEVKVRIALARHLDGLSNIDELVKILLEDDSAEVRQALAKYLHTQKPTAKTSETSDLLRRALFVSVNDVIIMIIVSMVISLTLFSFFI